MSGRSLSRTQRALYATWEQFSISVLAFQVMPFTQSVIHGVPAYISKHRDQIT